MRQHDDAPFLVSISAHTGVKIGTKKMKNTNTNIDTNTNTQTNEFMQTHGG